MYTSSSLVCHSISIWKIQPYFLCPFFINSYYSKPYMFLFKTTYMFTLTCSFARECKLNKGNVNILTVEQDSTNIVFMLIRVKKAGIP